MLLSIDAVVVQKERVMENFKRQVDLIVIGQYILLLWIVKIE